MKQILISLIGVVFLTVPSLNAQQVSASQTTVTQPQQAPTPSQSRIRAHPQRRIDRTAVITASNNSGHGRTNDNTSAAGQSPNADRGPNKGDDRNPAAVKKIDDNRNSYADALRRWQRERHDHAWWKRHYVVIVLVGGGYYYWDNGYWCPAWGYDPFHERYDYNGPIYTYGNLLPDQVIMNVQNALRELGYYTGNVTGSLDANTRHALKAYQADSGLDVTGAVDEPTVSSLGLV